MIGLSFHTGGLVHKPLRWVIGHLADLGYDAIEIVCGPRAHIRPFEITDPELRALRGTLETHRLRCVAINPYTVKPLMEMEREEGAEAFYRRLIEIAAALGAPTVNFLPGRLPEGDDATWRALVGVLKPLLHYAGDLGVGMTIHNHENQILDSPDKVGLMIEQIGHPSLRSLFDATNFHILGSRMPAAVARLAGRIQHCHLKGVIGRFPFHHFLVPGEPGDEFDTAGLVRALADHDYDGCISVETFSWMRDDKAVVAHNAIRPVLDALAAGTLAASAPVLELEPEALPVEEEDEAVLDATGLADAPVSEVEPGVEGGDGEATNGERELAAEEIPSSAEGEEAAAVEPDAVPAEPSRSAYLITPG